MGAVVRIVDPERCAALAGACRLSRWRGDERCCRWCDRPAAPGWPWCGNRCEDAYRANHWWDRARAAALGRDGHRCVRCGAGPLGLEVHHVEPRLGAGYGAGCHHHLVNLETLCRRHHLEVTLAQRRSCVGT